MTEPVRPRYRERQILRSDDLRDEQAYLLRMRRAHAIGQHRWGITDGLQLVGTATGFTLRPGAATDGYGRTLLVPDPLTVPGAAVEQCGGSADCWLVYRRDARPGRWHEHAVLRLTHADTADPRRPPGVPAADLDFPPYREPPDDPERQWPVHLGRLPDGTDRPYAGLRGESVQAPDGATAIGVDGTGRFTVADALVADRDGVTATGRAALDNGLAAGRLTLSEGTAADRARPWTLAHDARRLAAELPAPGPGGGRMAVGRTHGGTFAPCLSVDSACRVTVHGRLTVAGRVLRAPVPADPADPRFADAVLAPWIGGLSTAATELEAEYAGSLEVRVSEPDLSPDASQVVYRITVVNDGRAPVTDLEVDHAVVPPAGPRIPGPQSHRIRLEPGAAHPIEENVGLPADPPTGVWTVTATALGVGPMTRLVTATAQATFEIHGGLG